MVHGSCHTQQEPAINHRLHNLSTTQTLDIKKQIDYAQLLKDLTSTKEF